VKQGIDLSLNAEKYADEALKRVKEWESGLPFERDSDYKLVYRQKSHL